MTENLLPHGGQPAPFRDVGRDFSVISEAHRTWGGVAGAEGARPPKHPVGYRFFAPFAAGAFSAAGAVPAARCAA